MVITVISNGFVSLPLHGPTDPLLALALEQVTPTVLVEDRQGDKLVPIDVPVIINLPQNVILNKNQQVLQGTATPGSVIAN